jgi:thioredoxin 1
VACLCAAWCDSCRGYRPVFEHALRGLGVVAPHAVWIDIEDQAELVGAIDVENFPTLLIARGGEVLFFGAITPQPSTLVRLVRSALAGGQHLGGAVPDAAVCALAGRLQLRF